LGDAEVIVVPDGGKITRLQLLDPLADEMSD
jgi:hypothetical protein